MARRSIKSIISKPSEALQAMVDGLRKQSQRPNFRIDMSTYGSRNREAPGICFGCAATCTVQEIGGVDLSCDIIGNQYERSKALNLRQEEEYKFESAINDARSGNLLNLFNFFGIVRPSREYLWYKRDTYLGTRDWEEYLPKFERWIEQLQRAGY